MILDILGTKYNFIMSNPQKDLNLEDSAGYHNQYKKTIVIDEFYVPSKANGTAEIEIEIKKVKRHEIIHAFFSESGMSEWSDNEDLVDWIAWQFPKMIKAFEKVDAL